MKVQFIITILIAGLFIAACAKQAEVCPVETEGCPGYVAPPSHDTPPPPPVETPPAVETPPPVSEPPLPTEISTLFEKATTKTTSYQYQYQGPPHPNEIYNVYVKEDKMKVELPKGSASIHDLNYDTVYINVTAMTAKGYCERNYAYCKKSAGITAPAGDYTFKTPFQWIDSISTGAVKGSETFDKRAVYRLEYFVEGVRHNVLIDKFTGIPVQVLIGEDPKGVAVETRTIYTYKQFAANALVDSDFIHQEPG